MIKGREQTLARLSTLMQVGLSLGCYWLVTWAVATYLKPLNIDIHDNNTIYLLIIAIWYTLIKELNLGKMLRVKTYSELFAEYFALVVISSGLLHLGSLFLTESVPTLILALFACLNLFMLFGFRMLSYRIFKMLRGKGYNTRNVLIVADDESYLHFIDRMLFIRDWGYHVWAIMSDGKHIKTKYESHVRVLHEHFQLSEIIDANVVDEVIYCKGKFDNDEVRALIYACSEVGVTFRVYSELLSVVSQRSHLTYFKELPFLTFANHTKNYFALKVKELLDFLFSSAIVIFISPVLLAIAVAIKIEDGGSIFFRQRRVGLNGRIFDCLKFRTMVENAEALRVKLENLNEQSGPVFKIKNDPRVTRVGRFLRKTSLDELPQFFNVLKGEMSVVGPRPPIPSEVQQYQRWQRRRLSMKPGITCIWQVSGRNNIPFEEWMKLDMLYIDTWSLKLDLILFLSTIKVVFTGEGQ
ncbi:sugar transferase [Labilibaculum antarcticum]|uniref:UDP-phosphate galactose phosphotransferase n=1 Tax=Labilibaculum antarcticum TaxID=1717717 RepID=A0A1Y1CFK5_9BACT|nr:sugar transferase [Labilibaculum antarcticum]BAX78883.1 UDP-phosphate galactose phosphotransferase [Labilibaculum antarcticum]